MASPASAQTVPGLTAARVATGTSQPLFVTAPPGDYNRIFIVQKTGQIQILNLATGTLNATPFLDISARISTVSEQGLLGLAFDPNYSTNGKFYVNFVVPGGFWTNGTTHISQFQVSANADIADTSNEKILLTFDHPESNHNGGWIAFSNRPNDDHNLYIATGDGGNANDQGTGHIEPGGNAQNLTTLLGKLLRIHVDPVAGTASIPATNPFASVSGDRGEIFCYGLRNPFRDSFDRANGRLMIGDVGQDTREEIDVQDFSNPNGGENYEWRLREGTIATPTIQGQAPVGGSRPPGGIDPIFDYPHPPPAGGGLSGQTVIGGYVYRGRQIPALTGTYVFGDYLGPESGSINPNNFGRIYTLNYNGTSASNPQDITSELFTGTGFTLHNPTSFGEDANGELYTTDISTGAIYKIAPVTPNVIIDSITRDPVSGHAFVHGYGVPFNTHHVQFTNDLTEAFGSPGVAVTAAGDGSFSYEDTASGSLTARFYKVTYP